MGKIFGISDLPVSTITTALEQTKLEAPKVSCVSKMAYNGEDKFISKEKQPVSNAFVKMRNGIGKLLKHFSKAK